MYADPAHDLMYVLLKLFVGKARDLVCPGESDIPIVEMRTFMHLSVYCSRYSEDKLEKDREIQL